MWCNDCFQVPSHLIQFLSYLFGGKRTREDVMSIYIAEDENTCHCCNPELRRIAKQGLLLSNSFALRNLTLFYWGKETMRGSQLHVLCTCYELSALWHPCLVSFSQEHLPVFHKWAQMLRKISQWIGIGAGIHILASLTLNPIPDTFLLLTAFLLPSVLPFGCWCYLLYQKQTKGVLLFPNLSCLILFIYPLSNSVTG